MMNEQNCIYCTDNSCNLNCLYYYIAFILPFLYLLPISISTFLFHLSSVYPIMRDTSLESTPIPASNACFNRGFNLFSKLKVNELGYDVTKAIASFSSPRASNVKGQLWFQVANYIATKRAGHRCIIFDSSLSVKDKRCCNQFNFGSILSDIDILITIINN